LTSLRKSRLVTDKLVVLVDDDFIRCLFDIIEDLSFDVTDPYHYPVIRVLVSLEIGLNMSPADLMIAGVE
jgi:hypothetical protein